MSCERFERALIDVAAGVPAAPGLEAHLEGCQVCRALVDEQRRALKDVDRALRARLSAEPSPELAARVMSRLAEGEARASWRPAWLAAVAAGLGAALLAGWMARRPGGEVPAGPRQAATSPETRPRQDASRVTPSDRTATPTAPAVTRRRAATARVAVSAPRRAAVTDRAEPLVLVPPGQEEALRQFVTNLGRGTPPAPPLLVAGTSVDGAVQPPPLLEIPAVTVEPLSDPAVSRERSRR
jgi:hypothetical protein